MVTKKYFNWTQNLNSLPFRPSLSRSIFCFFFAISFATISEKSSPRLPAPGTPALPREFASYFRRNSSSDRPSNSPASSDTSTPFLRCKEHFGLYTRIVRNHNPHLRPPFFSKYSKWSTRNRAHVIPTFTSHQSPNRTLFLWHHLIQRSRPR